MNLAELQARKDLRYAALRATEAALVAGKFLARPLIQRWYEAKNEEIVFEYDSERCAILRDDAVRKPTRDEYQRVVTETKKGLSEALAKLSAINEHEPRLEAAYRAQLAALEQLAAEEG